MVEGKSSPAIGSGKPSARKAGSVAFLVTRGDLSLHAEFSEPAFEMFREPLALHRQLLAKLAPHGLKLTDMRAEDGEGSIGDHHLHCNLFNFTTSIRVGLERVQFNCFDVMKVDAATLRSASVASLEAVRTHLPQAAFRAHTFSLSLHGTLDGITPREFLGSFAADVPSELGPSAGTGLVYYYGAEAGRLTSSVVLDLSAVVADGLFVRTQVVLDAQKVAVTDVPTALEAYVLKVLERVGLNLAKE